MDPIVHVQKTVTNDSTFVSTDFDIEIPAGVLDFDVRQMPTTAAMLMGLGALTFVR